MSILQLQPKVKCVTTYSTVVVAIFMLWLCLAAPPSPDPSYIQGQFGFSAALDQSYLVVGCPRCFEDNGEYLTCNVDHKLPVQPTLYSCL